ncbi:GNAT family N-acetyltransferase [Paenibacillus dokdonensis]|uniref:GNAT family N-acetyltransferase n=1 Tax=Paenibacillus dokdonensis TaxID=2567944 RepID=UPI002DB6E807|nr:GNAT family protein [Paenibacillus dokdonensis]
MSLTGDVPEFIESLKEQKGSRILIVGGAENWGKGYCSEGVKLLLDYVFYEMNFHRVSLKVFSFNDRVFRL